MLTGLTALIAAFEGEVLVGAIVGVATEYAIPGFMAQHRARKGLRIIRGTIGKVLGRQMTPQEETVAKEELAK